MTEAARERRDVGKMGVVLMVMDINVLDVTRSFFLEEAHNDQLYQSLSSSTAADEVEPSAFINICSNFTGCNGLQELLLCVNGGESDRFDILHDVINDGFDNESSNDRHMKVDSTAKYVITSYSTEEVYC